MSSSARQALVAGAGIVGICCGLELQRRGWQVTLVDRLPPAQGCSFGNAGILAAQGVVPTALPGLTGQVPRLLLDRDGPLALRLRSLPHTLPWLLRLRRAATLAQARRSSAAMGALYCSTLERHRALAVEAGVPELVRERPSLYVHPDAAAIDVDAGLAWVLRRENGAQIELLDGAALHEAEPALSRAFTRGVRMQPMGFTPNPLRLAEAYAALFCARGGRLLRAEVQAVQPDGDRVALHAGGQRHLAQAVVLATGAWTAALLRPLGLKLPLVAERGYHLSVADPGIELRHVVTELAAHVAVTPMEAGLRIAGTEEIGLADDPPTWRRAERLRHPLQRLFPQARLGTASRWMGPRPGTPDSLPAIGALPGCARILVAAGHGHLGLTGAPHTGALVAALASGQDPGLDLAPYAPDRFRA
jgi:D-amino-acid dehydrogenase